MISAIVLAAGESTRMGNKNKLLLPFGDKLLIQQIVDNVLNSNVDETLVVVGYEAERIRDALRNRDIKFIDNSDFHEGMTTSIHAGIKNSNSKT
ncbi:MAG: NTP transferase domain-containing protein, partial [Candidatus Thorarchaeota archaeon]